jgi:hypothetical protein
MTITKLYNGGELREVFGNKWWYLNGVLHREDGPAVEYDDGEKHWYLNGKWHRENGPAIEYLGGAKEWYINDLLHREDGPAVENADGTKEWFLNDKQVSQKEFKRLLKLKAFW